jgi:hypothetical protein
LRQSAERAANISAPVALAPSPRRRVSFSSVYDGSIDGSNTAGSHAEVEGEAPTASVYPEPPPSLPFNDRSSLQGVDDYSSASQSDYDTDTDIDQDTSDTSSVVGVDSSAHLSPARIAAGKRTSQPHRGGRARTRPHALREDTNGLLLNLHRRFGHMPERKLRRFIKLCMATEYDDIKFLRMGHCVSCLLAKSTRLPAEKSDTNHDDLRPMQAVSADLVGKFRLFSTRGRRYIAIYVDHATGYIVSDCIAKKSDVLASIKRFVNNHVEFNGLKMNQLQVDFDKNYRDKAVQDYLLDKGIKMTYSAPYHHQGNDRAERAVRKVLDLARTLMIESSAPLKLTEFYIEWQLVC